MGEDVDRIDASTLQQFLQVRGRLLDGITCCKGSRPIETGVNRADDRDSLELFYDAAVVLPHPPTAYDCRSDHATWPIAPRQAVSSSSLTADAFSSTRHWRYVPGHLRYQGCGRTVHRTTSLV